MGTFIGLFSLILYSALATAIAHVTLIILLFNNNNFSSLGNF